MEAVSTIPDAIVPIVGARAWGTHRVAYQYYLTSISGWPSSNSYRWRPGDNIAKCWKESSHHAPEADCQCGFWAFGDPYDLPSNQYIYGVVELWGKVICGETGWRGQKARVIGVIRSEAVQESALEPLETKIAEMYDVSLLPKWPELSKPGPLWTPDESEDPDLFRRRVSPLDIAKKEISEELEKQLLRWDGNTIWMKD